MADTTRKRTARQYGSKKKPKFVPIGSNVVSGGGSGGGGGSLNRTAETRSYEVYSLPDGRLSMHYSDSVIPIDPQEIPPLDSGETPSDLLVEAVLGEFPVDQAEGLANEHTFEPYDPKTRKGRKRPELRAAAKMREWLPLRSDFLDEFIRYFGGEALIDGQLSRCSVCSLHPATVRCMECDDRELHCRQCIVNKHGNLSLHWLETLMKEWAGKTFMKKSLRAMGHIAHIGHGGSACPKFDGKSKTIVVGDITGIHKVNVAFCACFDTESEFTYEWAHLMRHGWFPASTNNPSTAFTFRLLTQFQELSFQAKTNLYDYWRTIERLTDNAGRERPIDRYKQLSHAVRIWRHLVSLKRAGRAHDVGGPGTTQLGELAVECPACPHPDKNLPEGWENTPPHVRWIYTLFLMLDANFKVKLRSRGLDDIEIAPGWSYFVEETAYISYMNRVGNQPEEKSTCSAEHKAILNANLRREGYLASGIGAVLCARHALFRRNGVGDVHNGEKYCIMDYLVCCTLLQLVFFLVMFSYDIACQWHRNLPKRLKDNIPSALQFDLDQAQARYAIPKKHIRVHGLNHSQYSFNYLPYVGRTYGEGIESAWSHLNPISASTREMSPGMRHETLNDHFGAWNWRKILSLAATLCANWKESHEMYSAQRKNFLDYTATFKPEVVQRWEKAIEAWNEDKSKPDPYEEKRETVTSNAVRKKIAEEEERDLGLGVPSVHEVTQGLFIQMGLDLEEQQRKLRARARDVSTGDCTLAEIQEKRNILRHRIELWQAIQDAHMPIAGQFRGSPTSPPPTLPSPAATPTAMSTISPAPTRAEHILLWLPSALPAGTRASAVLPLLCDKERRLRLAQADDALEEVRRMRRIITGLNEFKWLNLTGTGQRTGTRLRGSFATFKARLDRAANRYRDARTALHNLDPNGEWTHRMKELHDTDLRGPRHDDDDGDPKNFGEGYAQPSWIWTVARASDQSLESGDPDEFSEGMRVEWARAKARADRWGEEMQLVEEEMRRVIAYFEWKVRWWRSRSTVRPNAPLLVAQGLSAYAEKQSSVFEGLAQRCAELWIPLLRKHDKNPEWALRYPSVTSSGTTSVRQQKHSLYDPDEGVLVDVEEDSESESDGDMDRDVHVVVDN